MWIFKFYIFIAIWGEISSQIPEDVHIWHYMLLEFLLFNVHYEAILILIFSDISKYISHKRNKTCQSLSAGNCRWEYNLIRRDCFFKTSNFPSTPLLVQHYLEIYLTRFESIRNAADAKQPHQIKLLVVAFRLCMMYSIFM